jgi:hypothetical protein
MPAHALKITFSLDAEREKKCPHQFKIIYPSQLPPTPPQKKKKPSQAFMFSISRRTKSERKKKKKKKKETENNTISGIHIPKI